MKKVFVAIALVTAFATAAFADLILDPPKKPAKAVDTTLSIRIDSQAKEARLVIPRSQLKKLRAELEQLDGADADPPIAFSKVQNIVAGGLLSLAIVLGGVWFTRKGNMPKAGKALGVVAVMIAGGACAALVFANAGPPSIARSINGGIFSPAVHTYKSASGRIRLEVSDDARNVELIVPEAPQARPVEE